MKKSIIAALIAGTAILTGCATEQDDGYQDVSNQMHEVAPVNSASIEQCTTLFMRKADGMKARFPVLNDEPEDVTAASANHMCEAYYHMGQKAAGKQLDSDRIRIATFNMIVDGMKKYPSVPARYSNNFATDVGNILMNAFTYGQEDAQRGE